MRTFLLQTVEPQAAHQSYSPAGEAVEVSALRENLLPEGPHAEPLPQYSPPEVTLKLQETPENCPIDSLSALYGLNRCQMSFTCDEGKWVRIAGEKSSS